MVNIPSIIFIIPYRHRRQHRIFFTNYIEIIMADYPKDKWEFYFSHQVDERPFNRGAMKNIGFLAIKEKYPSHYKDITIVFNDVDTLPYNKNVLDYETHQGTIKHFYGYNFALGGIVSIKGSDFERLNGFPNYWAWGQEDNCMNNRALRSRIRIDRSVFFKSGDNSILQFYDGLTKTIMRGDIERTDHDNGSDGIRSIRDLRFEFVDHDIVIRNFEVSRKWTDETYTTKSLLDTAVKKTGMMNSMIYRK
jgi:hypothetical protein